LPKDGLTKGRRRGGETKRKQWVRRMRPEVIQAMERLGV
jgi:hypothetical protein